MLEGMAGSPSRLDLLAGGCRESVRGDGQRPVDVAGPKHFDVLAGILDEAGATVDLEALIGAGLVKNERERVKILGTGDLDRALTVTAHRFSASAREKIEAAGGACHALEHASGAN